MCSEGFCILNFVHKLSGRLGHQPLGALLIKCNFEQGIAAHRLYRHDQSSTDEEPHYGKYGMMRKTYLKEHRPAMYSDRKSTRLNSSHLV